MANGQKSKTEEIHCRPAVTHRNINTYVEYCSEKCENCRNVMKKARLIVTGTSESRRKNFEITCYGEHFSLCFSSGSRGNQVVVQVEGDKVHVKTTRVAWRAWLSEAFTSFWEDMKDIIVSFWEMGNMILTGRPAYQMIPDNNISIT